MNTKKILTSAIFLSFFLPIITWASSFSYTPMEQIPGFATDGNFYNYIAAVYKFGIWGVGVSALLMITIGGYMYISSAANVASVDKAKDVIADAVIGLILALVSYLLLYVINPNLVRLDKGSVASTATQTAATTGSPTATPVGATCTPTSACNCVSGVTCHDCVNCQAVSGLTCKESPCYLNTSLIEKLKTVNSTASWRITEAWPPTVTHSSSCHAVGTCADINISSGSGGDINDVKALSDALRNAGFSSYTYESANCAPFTAIGVPCKSYATMTGASFHVNN